MESLCAEVPVIGTDIRGTRDLLDDDCGLLVRVGDVEGLARAMTWILDHPQEARLLGRRGRAKMHHFDLKTVIRLHEDLYQKALGVRAEPSDTLTGVSP